MKQKSSLNAALIRIGLALILLAVSVGSLFFRQKTAEARPELYDVTVVKPTCTDPGYSLYTNRSDGSTYVDDMVDPPGHSWGSWNTAGVPSVAEPAVEARICGVCAAAEERVLYPQLNVPVVALEGSLTGIGKESEVPMAARFISPDREFSAFATLKHQGHDSLRYDKKNFTLKLYRDEGRSEKYKMTFSHWNEESKYILKGNYLDPSHIRNLVSADIWARTVAERASLPPEMKQLSNYGATDSFPVALYINREFYGLYSWTLHKDDDLFGMKKGRDHAILISNDDSAPEAYFRETAAFTGTSPWEVEFCGTENTLWAENKLNAFIRFVMDSDDDTFRKELKKHLDVDSAIDYYLSIYALGLPQQRGANLVLICYDKDLPFTASLFSMNKAFGLSADGTETAPPEEFLPGEPTGNLLWDRLAVLFRPEIEARYASLRKTAFDTEAMCRRVTECAAAIPGELTDADHAVYPHPNPGLAHEEQITRYIVRRMELLDTEFLTGEID